MKLDQPVLPTDVLETMILPTVAQAAMLEQSNYGILKPYQEGWYLPGESKPLIVAGEQYYKPEGFGYYHLVPVQDVMQEQCDIYNGLGVKIIGPETLRNKSKLLTPQPTIPSRGLRLFKDIIDYCIAEPSQWMHTSVYERRIRSAFLDELYDCIDIESVKGGMYNSITQVRHFIGEDVWNYYNTRFYGLDLVIDKCADYRICEWYRLKNPEQETDPIYETYRHT